MKILKYTLLVFALLACVITVEAQKEEEVLLNILDGLTDNEKLKILEYAKAQKKNIDEQILKVMDELPTQNKLLVVEFAQTLKDASVAASNGSDVKIEEHHHDGEESPAVNRFEKATSIKFEKSTIQFGTVREGNVVERTFRFQNTGNHPLEIISAKGSCGCTVPRVPQRPIPPKGYGTITVKFNTTQKVGKRTQSVTIIANTEPKVSQIYLQGEVIKDE